MQNGKRGSGLVLKCRWARGGTDEVPIYYLSEGAIRALREHPAVVMRVAFGTRSGMEQYLQGMKDYRGERWIVPCPPFPANRLAIEKGLTYYTMLKMSDDGYTFFAALEKIKARKVELVDVVPVQE